MTKQIGEYLVAAELCRRDFISTTFTGNVPEFDILAINKKHKTIPIQVKAIRSSSWQFDAKKYLNFEFENNKQIIISKTDLPYKNVICVFVKIDDQGNDEFYIFRFKDLQNMINKNYREILNKKGGVRPKNPKSTHTAIWTKELNKYRDNWGLIIDELK